MPALLGVVGQGEVRVASVRCRAGTGPGLAHNRPRKADEMLSPPITAAELARHLHGQGRSRQVARADLVVDRTDAAGELAAWVAGAELVGDLLIPDPRWLPRSHSAGWRSSRSRAARRRRMR